MGSWFSNLHIRKNGTITETTVVEYFRKIMTQQKYSPVDSEEEADGAFAIVTDDKSQWYSVYSDLFSFDEPNQFVGYATPMSDALKTDILGISCFDSDFIYLNLINAANKVDAWAGIGSAVGLGIRKRTNLSAWKNKVSDFGGFKESIKKKFVFAEEILAETEHCIHLPKEHSTASYEYLADLELNEQATYLYFKLPKVMKTQDPPRLVRHTTSLMPCSLDQPSTVSGINVGGASRGLSVYFVGPYVEKEEITFSNVCFVKWKNNETKSIPFELKKVQLSDGQWAYAYHDPGYRIFPKVDERLPIMKRVRMEHEHSIIVRFVPHGDPGKILDITVVLVPDKNPEGKTGWNAWHHWGSKKAFIEQYNKTWDEIRARSPESNTVPPILKEEDFD